MGLRARSLWVLLLVVLPLVGCNEVSDPTTAPLTLFVLGKNAPDDPGVPLVGVRLCETGTTNCAPSDPNGQVTIDLPIGTETSYTLEKEHYASYLVGVVIGADGAEYQFGLGSDDFTANQSDRLMTPYPMRLTGTIGLEIDPPFAGATFDLIGATGEEFYFDEEGWRSPTLEATTDWGWGGFYEVSPGDDFQANLSGVTGRCSVGLGWPGNVENSVRFPIREGFISWATFQCPLQP